MLAYVFWHAPAQGADVARYEQAQLAFQRSLAHNPPFGFRGSVVFRAAERPFETPGVPVRARVGYEDWYLVEDFTALGVLNEAAVGHGHRTSHDRAAHGIGSGTAAVYRLIEGEGIDAQALAGCPHATWVDKPLAGDAAALGTLLGDGIGGGGASLWQRQLVLGPAPEFAVQSRGEPAGVAPARLASGWSARTLTRETLFGGA